MYQLLRRSSLFLVVLMLLASSMPLVQAQGHALVVYNDPGYAGAFCYSDAPETANIAALCNDQISSIQLLAGWSMRGYRDQNQGGSSVCFNRSDANLSDNSFEDGSAADNAISSFTLSNQAWCAGAPTPAYPLEVYTDPDYGGTQCYSWQGEAANIFGSCNDQISSVLLRAGWSARVYGDQNQAGSRGCLTGSDSNLADNTFFDGAPMNDAISSFALYSQGNCANVAPNIPTLSGPANGSLFTTGPVTLTWSDPGDPDSWPRTYRDYSAEIWKSDNSWSTVLGWQAATSWSPALPGEGTYYWHVQSGDGLASSGWSGTGSFSVSTGPTPTIGNLGGRVTSTGSGTPIPGANVALGSRVTTSGADGMYHFTGIQAGSYSFSVTKDGYASHQSSATVTAMASTAKDVQLTSRLNGLSLPLTERRTYKQEDGVVSYVNAYVDLQAGGSIYDALHLPGTSVRIAGQNFKAPWPGNWRLGLAYNGHSGTDYNGTNNQTGVIAAADGYVLSYWDGDPDTYFDSRLKQWVNTNRHGNQVIMRLPDIKGQTVCVIYHHLKSGTIPAQIKQLAGKNITIPRGALLGRVGSSGMAFGTHLHFEVSNCNGQVIDPYSAHFWADGATALLALRGNALSAGASADTNLAPTAVFSTNTTVIHPGVGVNFDASTSQDSDGSIVQHLWHFDDGVEAEGQTIAHTYTAAGTYYVFLRTVDNAGSATLSNARAIIVTNQAGTPGLDIIPPQGGVAIAGTGYTATSPVTLKLALQQGESPATTKMRFSSDGISYSAWEPFQTQKTWSIGSAENTYAVYAQFADQAGNLSLSQKASVVMDTTPPNITINQPVTNPQLPWQVLFSWSVADIGVAAHGYMPTEYMLVNVDTSWQSANTGASAIYTGLPSGTYTFIVRIVDQAGNQSTKTLTATVDVPGGVVYLPLGRR